ncbi:MAG: imidazoleglycerol-phosphate dehydratase [Methanotrichaceae archaeon]|nr:imidazoleglycerol-phosphate dehydratase [Methanotrichaceae archaeon]
MNLRRGKSEVEWRGSKAKASINLDGSGEVDLASGLTFLDHMLHAFSRTGLLDLKAKSGGGNYNGEAIGSAIGRALDQALGDRSGIRRYGTASVPMDESLAEVALDLGGRSYLVFEGEFHSNRVGDLDTQQVRSILETLADGAGLTLHIRFYGENDHHEVESIFKALGLALRDAVRKEGIGVPSTKGII